MAVSNIKDVMLRFEAAADSPTDASPVAAGRPGASGRITGSGARRAWGLVDRDEMQGWYRAPTARHGRRARRGQLPHLPGHGHHRVSAQWRHARARPGHRRA